MDENHRSWPDSMAPYYVVAMYSDYFSYVW